MCIKREKNNTLEIMSETHTSSSNIETTHDVCEWLQNQRYTTQNIYQYQCVSN